MPNTLSKEYAESSVFFLCMSPNTSRSNGVSEKP